DADRRRPARRRRPQLHGRLELPALLRERRDDPLDKFIADDKYDLNQFYPFTIAITKLDGKVGGLPFKGHPSRVGIFYNRTLLEAAGAKVPTNDSSYDDLIEAAKKAHKPDAQQYGWSNPGLDSEWYILMSRFGGSKDVYSKDGTKSQLNDPEVQ